MSTKNYHFLLMFLVAIILVMTGLALSAPQTSVSAEIEKAALAEKWQLVADQCGPNEKLISSPVLRAIKGHALLALNQNNESLLLLLSIANDSDRQVWKLWASEFVKKNPASYVAHYFNGDAHARAEEWDLAKEAFDKALKIKSGFALALNARGVTLCAKGLWEEAYKDLEMVCKIASGFVDGHASMGTYSLYRQENTAAPINFKRARDLAPNFALAINGSGCARFRLGPMHWKQAAYEFADAGNQVSIPIFLINANIVREAAIEASSKANLYFRRDDFIDWPALRQVISNKSGILHTYFVQAFMPEELDRAVIDNFNKTLEDYRFFDKNQERIQVAFQVSAISANINNIQALERETKLIRAKDSKQLSADERSMIRGLNRAIMEELYPKMIAKAKKNNAGMSLTLTGGIAVNGYDYKSTLSTSDLIGGRNRMTDTYKPMANFTETVLGSIPIAGGVFKFIGKGWNDHLNASLKSTDAIFESRGVGGSARHAGGVSTAEMMELFFKQDEWTVVNWFGLAYNVSPSEN